MVRLIRTIYNVNELYLPNNFIEMNIDQYGQEALIPNGRNMANPFSPPVSDFLCLVKISNYIDTSRNIPCATWKEDDFNRDVKEYYGLRLVREDYLSVQEYRRFFSLKKLWLLEIASKNVVFMISPADAYNWLKSNELNNALNRFFPTGITTKDKKII